jgi:hypothetical protein
LGEKKSFRPDGILEEILNLEVDAMIPYLAKLLDITMKNNSIKSD